MSEHKNASKTADWDYHKDASVDEIGKASRVGYSDQSCSGDSGPELGLPGITTKAQVGDRWLLY